MTRCKVRLRFLAPLLFVAACGGGRSGTGITDSVGELVSSQPAASGAKAAADAATESTVSTIQGNVARLQLALGDSPRAPRASHSLAAVVRGLLPFAKSAVAATGLDGIQVTVEGTDAQGQTDANGIFSVLGDFAGPITLRFERADDGLLARMPLNVPKGGSLFLRDLTLDGANGQATADTQDLTFQGVVINPQCAQRQVEVASRFDSTGTTYIVDLADSSLTDASGRRIPCIALANGDTARVQGLMRPNGTIGSGNMTVDAQRKNVATVAGNAAAPLAKPPSPSVSLPQLPTP